MKIVFLLLFFFLLVFSGCLFGNAESITQSFREARENTTPNGLLVPPTLTRQNTYKSNLIALRPQLNSLQGKEKEALTAYVDGSLEIISLQQGLNELRDAVSGINPEFVECSPGSNGGNALRLLRENKNKGGKVLELFSKVKGETRIANALGAEYIENVIQTVNSIVEAQIEMETQLQANCVQQ